MLEKYITNNLRFLATFVICTVVNAKRKLGFNVKYNHEPNDYDFLRQLFISSVNSISRWAENNWK